jgi:DNA-directed RNA polymerase beta' subunit
MPKHSWRPAAASIGVDIVIVNASTEPKIKQALDRAVQQHADALRVHVDALFNEGRGQEQIVALAGQHRLPSMMATPPSRRGAASSAMARTPAS